MYEGVTFEFTDSEGGSDNMKLEVAVTLIKVTSTHQLNFGQYYFIDKIFTATTVFFL